MINYLINIMGLDAVGFDSDAGIILTFVIAVIMILLLVKVLIVWFDKLFGGT